jgi:CHASE3 domain sensor protein
MTQQQTSTRSSPAREAEQIETRPFLHWPGIRWLKGLNIGPKLSLGFGALLFLLVLVIIISFLAGGAVSETIRVTDEERLPTTLTATRAQANLLRMQANVRGYLALGDETFRTAYEQTRQAFEEDLRSLQQQKPEMTAVNQFRLEELEDIYGAWTAQPPELFRLRDDRLEREPAYRTLATDGVAYGGQVLLDLQQMIEAQSRRRPVTPAGAELLKEMANFQGSFAAMLSGLRNYVTTQNRIFRQEYESNLVLNEIAWQNLQERRGALNESQQELLDAIAVNRELFLELPEREIFPVLEAEDGRYRQDLYLFRNQTVPETDLMLALLNDITQDEQNRLANDLNESNQGLRQARTQTIAWGAVAIVLGFAMALLLSAIIVGPVTRLTNVAERISAGDLDARAPVVFEDEIGLLARTFNRMTTRLRQTLRQVRREKKRADDLLNVVIPIGVQLTTEDDFNRLLEKILLEAKSFCRAEAGSLYLRTEDDELQFMIVRNDVLNIALGGTSGNEVAYDPLPLYKGDGAPNTEHVAVYTALHGRPVNISDVYHAETDLDFSGAQEFDRRTGYHSQSMLTIPLRTVEGNVIGVMQLINARDSESGQITEFDENLQQMMVSFSSLAVAALEAYQREQALRQEIKQLRIEIDEAKLQQQVSETVETDFFQDLQAKARDIRRRRRRSRSDKQQGEE